AADFFYSDENKIDARGRGYDLFLKPEWSPERLRAQNYLNHLSVLRAELVREVGGFREGFDGSQDHDLFLRVTEKARQVVHIPAVLYHWRPVAGSAAAQIDAKPYAWDAGLRAVQEHLQRVGVQGEALKGPQPGTYELRYRPDPSWKVSVIVPTRGSSGTVWGERRVFVVEMVRSLLAKAGNVEVEVVVVHDLSTPDRVLEQLREIAGERLILVPFKWPFNFAAKCNVGFIHSTGDVVVLLNDDMEIIADRFLELLVGPLQERSVGMTGARLLFEDGTIQHAGMMFSQAKLFWHPHYQEPDTSTGTFGSLIVNREASGLTGACVALRREVYKEVGGLNEDLPVNFNDVDFSMKVAFLGYRRLWLSNATAFHFESQTRVAHVQRWEIDFILQRWALPRDDPYLPELAYDQVVRNDLKGD
ncbi:MAG: glycosyltransferase, partial [Bifidobacteriaceae bacterium]|nr:glycosyltransferase [Bifidobacteriaceae bacterium]